MRTTTDRNRATRPDDRPSKAGRRRRSGPAGDPLTLWRTTHPARISRSDVGRIARCVAGTEILHERRWRDARAGDGAAAAAIAIDHLRGCRERTLLSDLIFGNLVVLTERGDATAPMIIAHALRAFGRIDPADSDLTRLAACWSRRPARTSRPQRRRGRAGSAGD